MVKKLICEEAVISLSSFIVAFLFSFIPYLFSISGFDFHYTYVYNIWFFHVFVFATLNASARLRYHGFLYQVVVRSVFLGYAFGLGVIIFISTPPSWQMFGVYMAFLSFFHYSEFYSIASTNPEALSIDSFMLNHSLAYATAACSSWLEFLVGRYYFPELKEPSFISYVGFLLCLYGEILRKLAINTAKHNFNHLVQSEKKSNHELVTHGVYSIFRHPSYVGWFYWSIGTQLILQNPLCCFAYAVTSWRFFHDRILVEEVGLLNFFGEAYVEYKRNVGTGLPFISGYKLDL